MMPSLESVLSELDTDSDIISDPGVIGTPTPSLDYERQKSGTMLRHIVLQGISAQIASAAVSVNLFHEFSPFFKYKAGFGVLSKKCRYFFLHGKVI